MSYTKLMHSIGNLLQSLGKSRANIETGRAAKAYKKYAKEIVSGFNYASKYSKGDICWIEFGNNLTPEMSYQHMGIVMKKENRYLYVFPITTYDISRDGHSNAFHRIDNPNSTSRFMLLKASEYSFLEHDSVVKIEELRLVSLKRVISKCGTIDILSDDFQFIMSSSLKQLFPTIDYELNLVKKENSLLKLQLYLSNLRASYELENIDNLISQLSIPEAYRQIEHESVLIDEDKNIYEYTLELEDEYGQRDNKIITYTLINEIEDTNEDISEYEMPHI